MAPTTTTSSRSSSRVPVSDSGQATPILEVSRLISFYMTILSWRHGQRSVLDDGRHRAIRSSGVNSTFRDIQALGQMQVALARQTPPQVAAYLEIQAVASDLEVRRCFEQDTSYILLFRHFVGLFLGLRGGSGYLRNLPDIYRFSMTQAWKIFSASLIMSSLSFDTSRACDLGFWFTPVVFILGVVANL